MGSFASHFCSTGLSRGSSHSSHLLDQRAMPPSIVFHLPVSQQVWTLLSCSPFWFSFDSILQLILVTICEKYEKVQQQFQAFSPHSRAWPCLCRLRRLTKKMRKTTASKHSQNLADANVHRNTNTLEILSSQSGKLARAHEQFGSALALHFTHL